MSRLQNKQAWLSVCPRGRSALCSRHTHPQPRSPSRPSRPRLLGALLPRRSDLGKFPAGLEKQELGTSEGRKSELGGNPLLLTLCARESLAAALENKRRKF